MSQIEAKIAKNSNHAYYIQNNNQSNLNGTLWGAGGVCGTAASLGCLAGTAGSIAAIAGKNLVASYAPGIDDFINKIGVPVLPLLCGATVVTGIASFVTLKFTGFCFKNAIHHFGPQFEIVKTAERNRAVSNPAKAAETARHLPNKRNRLQFKA